MTPRLLRGSIYSNIFRFFRIFLDTKLQKVRKSMAQPSATLTYSEKNNELMSDSDENESGMDSDGARSGEDDEEMSDRGNDSRASC